MAHFVEGSAKGFVSTVALTMGTAVKLSAYNTVIPSTAATDASIGYVLEDAAIGRTASVKLLNGTGTAPAICGGTVTLGAFLVSNATGQVVVATQAGAGVQPTGNVIGVALEAGVAGQVIEVMPVSFKY